MDPCFLLPWHWLTVTHSGLALNLVSQDLTCCSTYHTTLPLFSHRAQPGLFPLLLQHCVGTPSATVTSFPEPSFWNCSRVSVCSSSGNSDVFLKLVFVNCHEGSGSRWYWSRSGLEKVIRLIQLLAETCQCCEGVRMSLCCWQLCGACPLARLSNPALLRWVLIRCC